MHIAILTGGPAAERGISEKSADLVAKYLDRHRYTFRLISIEENKWKEKSLF